MLEETNTLILNMDSNKAPGFDMISMKQIKENIDVLAPVIMRIINNGINEANFPEELKESIIRPIYKGENKQNYENYRPISIMNSISKLFEKYIAKKLLNYLEKFKIIDKKQYAYQENRGTGDLLDDMVDEMNERLHKGKHVLALSVDLSKPYDVVNHDNLFEALENIGVRGHSSKIFKSYLKGRSFRVKINNKVSHKEVLNIGIPQGSYLGPILYLIYVNDLRICFKNSQYFVYADDKMIISEHKNQKIAEENLRKEFGTFQKWCRDKGLSINENKTKIIHITTSHTIREPININFHDRSCIHKKIVNCECERKVEEVNKLKYLGIIIDKNLKWNKIWNRSLGGCSKNIYRISSNNTE